jgi:Ca2+:H+ antiporter
MPFNARIAGAVRSELALIVGIFTLGIFFTVGKTWLAMLDNVTMSLALFAWLFAVIGWCAFGVVRHAEVLAERLGEPLGTLILTISVVGIEATIMATVMLGGSPNPTLPRDTMFAILMIVLNGLVGLELILGALRHNQQHYNLQGAVVFLAVLTTLSIIALVLPKFTISTTDPTFTTEQAIVFGVLTTLLYAAFLFIQTRRHRQFFTEPDDTGAGGQPESHAPDGTAATPVHGVLLFITLLVIVMMTKPMAKLLDHGIEQTGLPVSLGAILIAMLVLAPEGLAAGQAAAQNRLQRAVNLSLGSALSTLGLTVPVVLAISVITGTPLNLGLDLEEIVLLVLTLFLSQMTFSGVPTNILLGTVHLVLFVTYLTLVFFP